MYLLMFIAAISVGVILCVLGVEDTKLNIQERQKRQQEFQDKLTEIRRAYDDIKLGMAYQEVVNLLGYDGEIQKEAVLPSGVKQMICVWDFGMYFSTEAIGNTRGHTESFGYTRNDSINTYGTVNTTSKTKVKQRRKILVVFENDKVTSREQIGFSKQDIIQQVSEIS